MITRRKFTLFLQLFVVILLMCSTIPASADSTIPMNKVPANVESTARRLMRDLEKEGYEVARGYFKLETQSDCIYTYEVLKSCLANNPAAPYVVPIMPSWSGEWIDPATIGMAGPTPKGYNPSYRLDPREAIVILGKLPPPAAYFGLQTYLVSRPGEWKVDSDQYQFLLNRSPFMLETFFAVIPDHPQRVQLWADLSNPINNVVIKNQSYSVWNQVRYFVTTPDQTMDSAVRQALARLDIPDNYVFTEPIPSDMTIGLGAEADDFLTVLRYAMPVDGGKDGTRSDQWREDLPLVVLRIRDTRPFHQPQTYPPVQFEPRFGATPPESSLSPDVITLAKAVCSQWGQPCPLAGTQSDQRTREWINTRPTPMSLTGTECVKVGMNCLAPTEDTAYFLSGKLPLPDNRVLAVVGALSTQTGNATYVGLSLNSSLYKLGYDNIDGEALAGSADGYDVPNSDQFFLQYFARDCTGLEALTAGSQCYSIGDMFPDCYDPYDLTCDMLVLGLRDYILPGTQRGPDPELTLSPLAIFLQRP